MAFFFIVGTKDFTKPLDGYENVVAYCQKCRNTSARPIRSWEWFTFCWIPVIPLGGKHKDLACPICRFRVAFDPNQLQQSGPPPQGYQHQQGPPQQYHPQQQYGGPPQQYGNGGYYAPNQGGPPK